MIDATTDTNCLLQELQMFKKKKKKVFMLKSPDDNFAYYKVSVWYRQSARHIYQYV